MRIAIGADHAGFALKQELGTYLHELGHAMGLAHPRDSGELMNSVLPMNLSSMQTGDRKGLYYVGRSQGCISF